MKASIAALSLLSVRVSSFRSALEEIGRGEILLAGDAEVFFFCDRDVGSRESSVGMSPGFTVMRFLVLGEHSGVITGLSSRFWPEWLELEVTGVDGRSESLSPSPSSLSSNGPPVTASRRHCDAFSRAYSMSTVSQLEVIRFLLRNRPGGSIAMTSLTSFLDNADFSFLEELMYSSRTARAIFLSFSLPTWRLFFPPLPIKTSLS